MRLHERETPVRHAERELNEAIWDVAAKYSLTEGERLAVVTASLGGHIGAMAKFMIPDERHGDLETPGGLEATQ